MNDNWDLTQPQHNVTYKDTIGHQIDEACRNVDNPIKPAESIADIYSQPLKRWPGFTAPMVYVDNPAEVQAHLDQGRMVCCLTIKDLKETIGEKKEKAE